MNRGMISTPATSGAAIDLTRTLESGQTFCWRRDHGEGEMFDDHTSPTYVTVLPAAESPTNDPEVIRVSQPDPDELRWEAAFDAKSIVSKLLRLDDDLTEIHDALPDSQLLDEAFASERGLRMPHDPVFPTLIAFICSAQMSVPRIHAMQVAMAEAFGKTVVFDGTEYAAFPTPADLDTAGEEALRDLKLGYRAPYVVETATQIHTGEYPTAFKSLSYGDAHARLTQYMGVGDKVADCVQLYALGHLSAFPVDTWIRTVLDDHYSYDILHDSYIATREAAKDHFGPYAGYAQSYLFAHVRSESLSSD